MNYKTTKYRMRKEIATTKKVKQMSFLDITFQ